MPPELSHLIYRYPVFIGLNCNENENERIILLLFYALCIQIKDYSLEYKKKKLMKFLSLGPLLIDNEVFERYDFSKCLSNDYINGLFKEMGKFRIKTNNMQFMTISCAFSAIFNNNSESDIIKALANSLKHRVVTVKLDSSFKTIKVDVENDNKNYNTCLLFGKKCYLLFTRTQVDKLKLADIVSINKKIKDSKRLEYDKKYGKNYVNTFFNNELLKELYEGTPKEFYEEEKDKNKKSIYEEFVHSTRIISDDIWAAINIYKRLSNSSTTETTSSYTTNLNNLCDNIKKTLENYYDLINAEEFTEDPKLCPNEVKEILRLMESEKEKSTENSYKKSKGKRKK